MPPRKPYRKCGVTICKRPVRRGSEEYCDAHQLRLRRHGDVDADRPIEARKRQPVPRQLPDDPENTRWLLTGQVAVLFGVDRKTVIRWADEGRIPHKRTDGGHRRFDPAVIYPVVGKDIPEPDEGNFAARCRNCGCSDEESCFGGCTWVAEQTTAEGEICSRCVAVLARRQRIPVGVS